MTCEILITGVPTFVTKHIIPKVLGTQPICKTRAKRNLHGDTIKLWGTEQPLEITIKKGEEFLVFSGTEMKYFILKQYLFMFKNAKIYRLEDIVLQKKWKGQPYKFFFKDCLISSI